MKWQRFGENKIASIMITGIDNFRESLANVMGDGFIDYSGIVISTNGDLAKGDKIEKRCYSKGGFKFLYRDYLEENEPVENFPVNRLKEFIEKIAKLYFIEVLEIRAEG
ncbi:hypothetical protein ABC502_09120 [Alkalimonas sp. NCh-2]|uniref:hypothetical protein n=1 Tax=Alkalimonas sp. NCh-2 TaxID=3144846 RepID=UPI0031F674E5